MKIVIFSDLHANIYALNNLLKKESDADEFISLGDNVGYGPHNNECLEVLIDKKISSVMGNHEEYFLRGYPSKHCTENAKGFFDASYALFDKKYISYLKEEFPPSLSLQENTFQHTINDKYIYPNTDISLEFLENNTFIGHSHIQFIKYHKDKYLCNVGSLGQNRRDMSVGQYVVWYPEKQAIVPMYIDVGVDMLVRDMKNCLYHNNLIDYYNKRV